MKEKSKYVKPKLTVYGPMKKLTWGAHSGNGDGYNQGKKR